VGASSTVYAGDGENTIMVTGDSSTVFDGNGDNTIVVTGDSSTVFDGNGNDEIFMLAGTTTGSNTAFLGNGTNLVVLTGQDTVLEGTGTDTIWGGSGADTFVSAAGGGSSTIYGFNASDQLDLSFILAGLTLTPTDAGLAGIVSVSEQADYRYGSSGEDTLLKVVGTGGTANIALIGYNAGGLSGLLAHNNLVLPS
jgi:Ca2+-binding RTX toxin-like protein